LARAVLGREQIETPIHRDPKAEPGPGAKLEHAHAALRPIGVFEQLDPGELLQGAGPCADLGPRPGPSEQLDHGVSLAFVHRPQEACSIT
jgi:hypothetical protein